MPIRNINIGTSPNDGKGDPLRTGGQKINDSFAYVDSMLNNNIVHRYYYISPSDFDSGDPKEIVADRINQDGLVIGKDQIFKIVASRAIAIQFGTGVDDFVLAFENRYYDWHPGRGEWGTVNGNTVTKDFFSLISTNTLIPDDSNSYDLGEIGSTPIEDAVNGSGPYTVPPNLFLSKRNGQDFVYLYTGNSPEIGVGTNPTVASDFEDVTDENITPPDLSDYVNYGVFDESLYDRATPGFSTDIDNFNSLTDKFYILEVTSENKHYFASRQDNVEALNGARIYLRKSQTHHDLESPTLSQNGYDFWDLGNIGVTINASSTSFSFQFWIKKGGTGSGSGIIVDGQGFNYYPLPSNTTGTLLHGEVAKCGYYNNGSRWVFVELMVFNGSNGTQLNSSSITDWDIKTEY